MTFLGDSGENSQAIWLVSEALLSTLTLTVSPKKHRRLESGWTRNLSPCWQLALKRPPDYRSVFCQVHKRRCGPRVCIVSGSEGRCSLRCSRAGVKMTKTVLLQCAQRRRGQVGCKYEVPRGVFLRWLQHDHWFVPSPASERGFTVGRIGGVLVVCWKYILS
jgi:hypothetical protein